MLSMITAGSTRIDGAERGPHSRNCDRTDICDRRRQDCRFCSPADHCARFDFASLGRRSVDVMLVNCQERDLVETFPSLGAYLKRRDGWSQVNQNFDAVAYLRHESERALIAPKGEAGFPLGSGLLAAARALTAIDAVSQSNAQAILDECSAILQIDLPHFAQAGRSLSSSADRHLLVVIVRELKAELSYEWGCLRLHFARFANDYLFIEVTAVGDSDDQISDLWHTSFLLADETGSTVSARFEGIIEGRQGGGQLITDGSLSAQTNVLIIDGVECELNPRKRYPAFTPAEDLHVSDRAEQHLMVLMTEYFAGEVPGSFQEAFEAAAQALVAAGALREDSEILAQLRTVLLALPLRSDQVPSVDVEQPWKSIIHRWYERDDVHTPRALSVGSLSPEVDGFLTRVDGIVIDSISFHVRAEIAPTPVVRTDLAADVLMPQRLHWLARDDCDNFYVGHMRFDSNHVGAGLTVTFRPPLFKSAGELNLMLIGRRHCTSLTLSGLSS